jgi:hypothetical protein
MRKLLATAVLLFMGATVAHAGPLTPPVCIGPGAAPTPEECIAGPPVLGPFPVAGEGFMPIPNNPSGGTVGPRVDWIVMRNPGLTGPGENEFLYLYQVESASGAAPGLTAGDIRSLTLTTGLGLADPFHDLTSFGVAAGDLDNNDTRLFFGTAIPTAGQIDVSTLVLYGAASISGHNAVNFPNLGGVPAEGEESAFGEPFGDAEGDEVAVDELEGNPEKLAWEFIRSIIHANPAEESVILWAMGPRPVYGAAVAVDGDPFSPWSTANTNGRPVPVATTIPEPASLLLLGSGMIVAGVIARRFGLRKP